MKTFRKIGMALFAVLVCVNFSSCTKDEALDGNEDFSNEKKLVKIVGMDDKGEKMEVFTYRYDDKGRLIESTGSIDYGQEPLTTQYVWGDNVIMNDDDYTVALENGRIKSNSDNETFTYNSSNRITKGVGGHHTVTITWDGDKIVSMSSYMGSNLRFTYGKTCKKGYCPLIPYLMFPYDDLSMAHPELFGARSKQLPTMVDDTSLTYEFDNEGYITKIYLNQSRPMVLTWE